MGTGRSSICIAFRMPFRKRRLEAITAMRHERDLIASLERFVALNPDVLLPAHGPADC